MIEKLLEIEKQMPALFDNPDNWQSLLVDYHPPVVDRLYRDVGDLRVFLHAIYPSEGDSFLFHPHPWPSAMKILFGTYKMDVGYGNGNTPPEVAATMWLNEGCYYEMVNQDAWHSVEPVTPVVYTIMVTGKPWGRVAPKPTKQLFPLAPEVKNPLFDLFKRFYLES